MTSAAKNNRRLLEEVFGRTTTTIYQHTPHPQIRSVLEQMEAEHPDIFAKVAASRFRHPDDVSIASSLHHSYAYALGMAVPGRLDYLYLDLSHPMAEARLRRLTRDRGFDVFCLNDSPGAGGDDEGRATIMDAALRRYYPLPSSFERGSPRRPDSVPDRRLDSRVAV